MNAGLTGVVFCLWICPIALILSCSSHKRYVYKNGNVEYKAVRGKLILIERAVDEGLINLKFKQSFKEDELIYVAYDTNLNNFDRYVVNKKYYINMHSLLPGKFGDLVLISPGEYNPIRSTTLKGISISVEDNSDLFYQDVFIIVDCR